MPSKPESLEWIDIADFSPGITSTHDSDITPASEGYASDAYMCVPGPQGGLIPAPRLTATYSYPSIANVPVGRRDPNLPYAAVLDIACLGIPQTRGAMVTDEASGSLTVPVDSVDEIYTLFQHYDLNTPNQRRVATLQSKSANATGTISQSYAESIGVGAANITYTTPTAGAMTFNTSWRYYGPGNIAQVYAAASTGKVPSYGLLACISLRSNGTPVAPMDVVSNAMWSWGGISITAPGWYPITNDGTSAGVARRWTLIGYASLPNDFEIEERINPTYVTGHQNRGVSAVSAERYGLWVGATVSGDIAGYGADIASSIRFSAQGTVHNVDSWESYVDVTDPIGGIAGMASLTSDDLFIIGQNGGCARIRGDLATSPQTTRMPMLPSGFGRATHIAHTPVGLVWGTRNGVWLWTGGDTAELISPQLSFDFWWSDAIWGKHSYMAPKGRPVCSYPYLFFPNGWLCDLRFKSWFRFGATDSPTGTGFRPIHYTLAYNGDVLACQPVAPIDGTASDMIRRYDPSRYHTNWTWTSQPFAKTRNRVLSFREIAVTVHNPTSSNDFTVTLTGDKPDGGTATWTKTVTVAARATPQVLRFEMALDVAESILSMSTTAGSGDALAVNRVGIGYSAERSVKRY